MDILTRLFNDPKLDAMLSKFNAGAGQEDLKSELFAILCEKKPEYIQELSDNNQLMFYATGIVQRMIFQPNNQFNRRYRLQAYEYSEAILNNAEENTTGDKEKQLQKLEEAIDKNLHWVEKTVLKLHQDLGSMDEISKRTKISYNQVKRIYSKSKEKLKTALSGKLMGNYVVITNEMVLDIPHNVTPDNINDILEEVLDYMKMRLEGRMIPSKEKTNGYIKDIKPIKVKQVI